MKKEFERTQAMAPEPLPPMVPLPYEKSALSSTVGYGTEEGHVFATLTAEHAAAFTGGGIYPEVEDCLADSIPYGTKPKKGTRTIKTADLVSMWQFMLTRRYANRRRDFYYYLTNELDSGRLSQTVGFRVLNRVINREACELVSVDLWKIDRENLYADVRVKLTLHSPTGIREWNGVIVCWCSFNPGFSMSIEDMCCSIDREKDGFTRLSPFLIPYYTNQKMDEIGDRLWKNYDMPDALTDPKLRDAEELARRMGLEIKYLDVYEHRKMNSILFFADSDLVVGEDREIVHPDGTKETVKTGYPETVRIPANTIVVNTNRVSKECAAFSIFHECIHYYLHYMFFCLQQMASNDIRLIKVKKMEVEEGKKLSDPIYFMEKQANRGAYALIMPVNDTRKRIDAECAKATGYKNAGEKYEIAGKALRWQISVPHFRIRARMIQLGYIEARGALNYVGRELIQPFAFDPESWRGSEYTYVISGATAIDLRENDKDFDAVMATKKFIYADGHIVRNEPRFVMKKDDKLLLTEEAAGRVDDCCLRFRREYVQENVGKYTLGRMFYDPHYVERTLFYLGDIMNQKQLDELDAKVEYKDSFPRTFVDAFDMLMKKNGETRESLAPKLHTTDRTLHDWLYDPVRRITPDFIIGVSLMWQLPDWISKMLMERACICLNEYDRRQRALEYIRTALWDKGIEEANKFLKEKGLAPLEI